MTDVAGLPEVAVIGLGAIGGNVCRRLLAYGVSVTAYDIEPAAMAQVHECGAAVANSAAEAVRVGLVVTSLPDDRALRDLTLNPDVLQSLDGSTLVEMSTVLPSTMIEIGDSVAARGGAVLDAPFSGGVAQVSSGTLMFYASGDPAALETARCVLELLGTITYVGALGQGKAMKLVNNVMSIGNMAIAAEAFALGKRLGLEPHDMLELVGRSGGRSDALLRRMPRVLEGDFVPGFSLALSDKDIALALTCAEEQRLHMPTCEGLRALLHLGVDEGLGDFDLGAIAKVFEP